MTLSGISVLWLRPPKGDHISVGRQRLAEHLQSRGADVELRGVTADTAKDVARNGPEADVVIGTTRSGALVGLAAKVRHGVPLIVDHVDPIRQFYDTAPTYLAAPVHIAESTAFRLADHICWVTKDDAPRVQRWGTSYTKTTLGVPFRKFSEPPQQAVSAARGVLRSKTLRSRLAVYVGGLEPIYKVEKMVAGFRRTDNWSLVVLGDGSKAEFVEAAAADSDQIIYPGTVPHEHVPGYLHHADIGVCLADERTVKVLEYAAARLPILHADGHAADRFGDLVRTVAPRQLPISRALDSVAEWPDWKLDEMQAYARERDWSRVADVYAEAVGRVAAPTPVPEPEPTPTEELATDGRGG